MTETVWPAKPEVFTSDPSQIRFADPLVGTGMYYKGEQPQSFSRVQVLTTNVFLDALVKGVSSGFSCVM